MGAIPEFAPAGQDHILRSTSVVQTVRYGEHSVEYRTFDGAATEVLRLSFKPSMINAGGASLAEDGSAKPEGYTLRPLGGGDWVLLFKDAATAEIYTKG